MERAFRLTELLIQYEVAVEQQKLASIRAEIVKNLVIEVPRQEMELVNLPKRRKLDE